MNGRGLQKSTRAGILKNCSDNTKTRYFLATVADLDSCAHFTQRQAAVFSDVCYGGLLTALTFPVVLLSSYLFLCFCLNDLMAYRYPTLKENNFVLFL